MEILYTSDQPDSTGSTYPQRCAPPEVFILLCLVRLITKQSLLDVRMKGVNLMIITEDDEV